MNDKEHFTWIADPGHAWLRVPSRVVNELRIADKISTYSFWGSDWIDGRLVMVAWLEEDCDAAVFAHAMKDAGREWDAQVVEVNYFDRSRPVFNGERKIPQ